MRPLTREEIQAAKYIGRGAGGVKRFIEFTFSDDKDNPIILAPHHHYAHDFRAEQHKKGNVWNVFMMPFESGKTQNFAIYIPLYEFGFNHNIRTKLFTANERIAKNRTGANKVNIEKNIRYRAVFPDVKPSRTYSDFDKKNSKNVGAIEEWGKNAFTIDRTAATLTDPTFEARGITSSVMGGRIDHMILDDVTDYQNSLSQVKREAVKGSVRANAFSRISQDCIVDVIGTPWHPDDALSTMFNDEPWQHLKMPIKKDLSCFEVFVNGEKVEELPMWDRLSAESIEKKKNSAAYGFAMVKAGIHLEHYALGYRIIENAEKHVIFNSHPKDYKYDFICGGIDYASDKRPGTVVVLLGIRTDGVKIPIEARFMNKAEQLPSHLVDMVGKYDIDHFNAESNATQSVITAMIRPYRIGKVIKDFCTGANKKDPRSGLPRISDEFNEGYHQIHIPHPPPFCNCSFCRLAQQIIMASWSDDNTPDGLMGYWFADEGIGKRTQSLPCMVIQ